MERLKNSKHGRVKSRPSFLLTCLEDKASPWLAGYLFIYFPPSFSVWEPEEGWGDSVCQGKAGRDNEERRMMVGVKV